MLRCTPLSTPPFAKPNLFPEKCNDGKISITTKTVNVNNIESGNLKFTILAFQKSKRVNKEVTMQYQIPIGIFKKYANKITKLATIKNIGKKNNKLVVINCNADLNN